MNTMIPTDDKFIEEIARAVGKDRLIREANDLLKSVTGVNMKEAGITDQRFDREFEKLWNSDDDESIWNRQEYMADARAAVNRINLLLLTMT